MRVIRIELPKEIKQLELHIFADLHIGDKSCDYSLIQDRIEYCEMHDNVAVILNGDLMNNATKTSVSDSYAEELTPMQQIQQCTKLFGKLAEQGKIIAITTGNHERRTYNKEGIDLTEVFASQLGLHDKFTKGAALIFLRFGELGTKYHNRKARYTILCLHGSGGGRKEGSKVVRLADMATIADADIYIHAHTHLPFIMKESYIRTDTGNSSIAYVDKLFINTAATLDYGGYGEVFEFKPSSKDNPVIFLDGTKRKMTAKL